LTQSAQSKNAKFREGFRGETWLPLRQGFLQMLAGVLSLADVGLTLDGHSIIFFSTRERRMVQPMKIDCSSCNNQREVTEA
jgi:hypothetical protein